MDLDNNTLTPLGVAYLTHDPLPGDGDTSGAAASPIFAAGGAVRDRSLLWAPPEAGAGAGAGPASSSSSTITTTSSPSRGSRQPSDREAGQSWNERCEACINYVKGSEQSGEALPAEQRHICSAGCGFWA